MPDNSILILAIAFAFILLAVVVFFRDREKANSIKLLNERIDSKLDTKETKDAFEENYLAAPDRTKALVDLFKVAPESALLLLTHPILTGLTPGIAGEKRKDLINLAKTIEQFLDEATDSKPNESGTISFGESPETPQVNVNVNLDGSSG